MIMALLIAAFMPSFVSEHGPVIGTSTDNGASWNLLNGGERVFTTSPGMARDFSIMAGTDGWVYVAYTAGNYGGDGYFSISRTRDYIAWEFVCNVSDPSGTPVDSGRSWGPKLVQDDNGSVYAFIACGVGEHPFGPFDMQIYYTRFTNPWNLAAGWSDFTRAVVPDMDAVLNEVQVFKVPDGTWRMQVLNFTANDYQTYSGTSLTGTWGNSTSMGFAAREGIFSLRNDDGTYRVFSAFANDATPRYKYQTFAATFAANGNPRIVTTVDPLVQIENGEPFEATGSFYLAFFPYSATGAYSASGSYS